MKNSLLRVVAGAVLTMVGSGCAGYQLGSMLPPDIKTVYVPTFVNKTQEPLIEVETTQATIEDFQRDGSLRVVNEDQADTVLAVELKEYKIEPVAYRKDSKTSAKEYRITMFASILLTRRVDGSIVAQNPRVKGEAVFPFAGDLTSSKLTGLPAAADDLAHNIVEQVVESW
jgi:hypothetical protein